MEQSLKRVGMTRFLLWQDYKEKYPSGVQYSRFCEHFNRYLKSNALSYVFEHKAGDKLMVDFAGKKLHLVDSETGELIWVEFFVGILACSGYTYAKACMSQQSADFLDCIGSCLEFIGGVPQAIVCDNLKPAVNKASKYDPQINQSMADFGVHYDTAILPTRAHKPKDKALVESAVSILYTRVYAKLHGLVFHTLKDLNKAIIDLLDVHNRMLFQGKETSRLLQFETLEKPTLKPLADTCFELRKYQKAKVHPNCHVLLSQDKHHYSVPYGYVGQSVTISYNQNTVEIFSQYHRIATHTRLARYGYSTNASHLHPTHRYYSNWSKEFFLEKGTQIGPSTQLLMSGIMSQCKHPEQGFKLCQGVLSLAGKYGAQQMEVAAEICLQYNMISYHKLESVLKLDLNAILKEDSPLVEISQHQNLRGSSYYQ